MKGQAERSHRQSDFSPIKGYTFQWPEMTKAQTPSNNRDHLITEVSTHMMATYFLDTAERLEASIRDTRILQILRFSDCKT